MEEIENIKIHHNRPLLKKKNKNISCKNYIPSVFCFHLTLFDSFENETLSRGVLQVDLLYSSKREYITISYM